MWVISQIEINVQLSVYANYLVRLGSSLLDGALFTSVAGLSPWDIGGDAG